MPRARKDKLTLMLEQSRKNFAREFAGNLSYYRMTSREVAKLLGVDESTISKWKKNGIANIGQEKQLQLFDVMHFTEKQKLMIYFPYEEQRRELGKGGEKCPI